jgi:hypothetical protein
MYCRVTFYRILPGKRAEALRYVEETIKPRLRTLGVTQAYWGGARASNGR